MGSSQAAGSHDDLAPFLCSPSWSHRKPVPLRALCELATWNVGLPHPIYPCLLPKCPLLYVLDDPSGASSLFHAHPTGTSGNDDPGGFRVFQGDSDFFCGPVGGDFTLSVSGRPRVSQKAFGSFGLKLLLDPVNPPIRLHLHD